MKAKSEHYYYEPRYRNLTDQIKSFTDKCKWKLLAFISRKKTLSKKLSVWESFGFYEKKWLANYNLYTKDLNEKYNYYYKEISLSTIIFIEVIEIDNFDAFRKKVIERFGEIHSPFSRNKKELDSKLSEVKRDFDSISFGSLFYIDYDKERGKKNDLLDSVQCGYIKINESYFILSFEISLSKKGNEIFKNIIHQKDVSFTRPNYNSFLKILTNKRFYSSESFYYSLKCVSIKNLISDLNYQVRNNLTKHFKGYFYDSDIFKITPSVELYEVENIAEFKKDKKLLDNFDNDFGKYYSLPDEKIEIYRSDQPNKKHEFIQIVKQKGHGDKAHNTNDFTNYDKLENHYLSESLIFPCVFSAILEELNGRLNTVKRKIYDQIKISRGNTWMSYLIYWNSSRRYLYLKQQMIQILMTLKRFETEFTDENLALYTSDSDLQNFIARYTRNNEETNLSKEIIKSLRYKIKTLDDKTKSLNEIFKPLEEFNGYKTNLYLQRFSIFIAFLAFIFTFSKAKIFVMIIIHKIFK